MLLFISVIGVAFASSISDSPVRINKLHLPNVVHTGEDALLRCDYEVGDEKLRVVKWHKDGIEFFRYSPSPKPAFKSFPMHYWGIDVDMNKSSNDTVFLKNLTMDSAGNYTCEVYAGKSQYKSDSASEFLNLKVSPSDYPVLMTDKDDYELGDNVSVLCTSGKAVSSPNLKWYINDQLVRSGFSKPRTVYNPDETRQTNSTLKFHFNGTAIVKCVAIVNHIQAEAIIEFRPSSSVQTEVNKILIYLFLFMFLSKIK